MEPELRDTSTESDLRGADGSTSAGRGHLSVDFSPDPAAKRENEL